ncbi:hypothetical protein CEXT_153001 [Caerostris extrusa]|uniref:C2H2-type domain-containing protein n=1 Tax=Caerostris extrusa TaxID=172846 RepID=A0AAV4UPB6_CAEEX|nr:hypothetical protein CEXT_153001 [Caerostris extrusa]
MEIRNCEFCNAYVANFEVHTCRIFGHQHRQCVTTLPRSSSGNISQDIDLKTEQIHYEGRIPSMNQESSSWHHSTLSNIHQRTDCEATAAAEESSQYGLRIRIHPTEANSAIINPNPQFCEPWNPNPDVNAALPVAEPCFLPGFQQTFGQRNALMNQMHQHPNASCQMEAEFLPKDHVEPPVLSRNVATSHTCNYCDKAFPCRYRLTRHVRVHTGKSLMHVRYAIKALIPVPTEPPTPAPIWAKKAP